MKKFNFYKNILVVLTMLLFGFSALVSSAPALAQVDGPDIGLHYIKEGDLGLESGGDVNLQQLIVSIVKYLMTFLGIIAVVIILYGGFVWMTAGGNDDRVGKAKRIITAGIIGLAIILAAFAIVTFVNKITQDALDGEFEG